MFQEERDQWKQMSQRVETKSIKLIPISVKDDSLRK